MFKSSEETHFEGVSCRGGVEILLIVLGIDSGAGTSLYFDIDTVQYWSSPYDNLRNLLGINNCDDNNAYDVIFLNNVVGRIAVL